MKTLTLFVSALLLTLTACDTGDAAPDCEMLLVGAQGTTPPGTKPWAAVEIKGDNCAAAAADLRVSMYETTPAMYYHGDGAIVSTEQVAATTTCAIFEWPEWETSISNWGLILTPPARAVPGDAVPRATYLSTEQIPSYVSGGPSPVWRDPYAGWLLYPASPANVAACRPNSKR